MGRITNWKNIDDDSPAWEHRIYRNLIVEIGNPKQGDKYMARAGVKNIDAYSVYGRTEIVGPVDQVSHNNKQELRDHVVDKLRENPEGFDIISAQPPMRRVAMSQDQWGDLDFAISDVKKRILDRVNGSSPRSDQLTTHSSEQMERMYNTVKALKNMDDTTKDVGLVMAMPDIALLQSAAGLYYNDQFEIGIRQKNRLDDIVTILQNASVGDSKTAGFSFDRRIE